jgi:hypothetical protein
MLDLDDHLSAEQFEVGALDNDLLSIALLGVCLELVTV